MPEPLTPVQLDTLRLIDEWIARFGVAPTLDEMRHELDLGSKGGMFRILCILEEKGWITRKPHRARMITVLHKPPPCDEPEVEVTEAGRAAVVSR